MVTINTADDLIEVLRKDDRVRSAVRRELLTDELIAMPEKVDKMVEAQTAMQESLTAMQQTQDSMLKTQTAILKDIKGIRKEQKSLRKTHVADREESIQEMHRFRGNYAVSAAAKDTVGVAMPFARQKNMRQIRCDEVSQGELKDLIANCEDEQVLSGFSDDDLNYFPQVDVAFGVMGEGSAARCSTLRWRLAIQLTAATWTVWWFAPRYWGRLQEGLIRGSRFRTHQPDGRSQGYRRR